MKYQIWISLLPLNENSFDGLPWFEAILACVEDIGQENFSLSDMYSYVGVLSEAYPNNSEIESKIRQQLQYLRNAEVLEFLDGKGNYRLLAKEFLRKLDIDYSSFTITRTALPNLLPGEIGEKPQKTYRVRRSVKGEISRLRNKRLGEMGEQLIIVNERMRLINIGREDLANKVEQVSKTKGDHAGYDILSFNPDGNEKWIEVKTTKGHQSTKFHISENQICTSEANPLKYHLYRLFEFDINTYSAKLYNLQGDLRRQLHLEPTDYLAQVQAN